VADGVANGSIVPISRQQGYHDLALYNVRVVRIGFAEIQALIYGSINFIEF
jgi:ribosomal protein L3